MATLKRPMLGPLDIALLAGLIQLLLLWLVLEDSTTLQTFFVVTLASFMLAEANDNLVIAKIYSGKNDGKEYDRGPSRMRGQGVALRSFLAMVIIFSAVVTLAAQRELGDKPWPYAEYALLAVGTVPAWGIRPYLRGLEDEG